MIEETTGESYSSEHAFVVATAGSELFGVPLRKFSLSRKDAADRMGWEHPRTDAEKLRALSARGAYPGALADVRIVLWLCTLKDTSDQTLDERRAGEFTPDLALNLPDEARRLSRDWAERVGIDDTTSEAFATAYTAYLQIVFALDASLFEVKPENTGGPPPHESSPPKARPGPPSARKSSRVSRGSPGKTRNTSARK